MRVHHLVGQSFVDERLGVDGTTFERCTFTRCQIVFSAAEAVVLKECTFTDCNWVFAGPAETTLSYLSALYSGLHPAGEDLVETIFQAIREGTIGDDVVAVTTRPTASIVG